MCTCTSILIWISYQNNRLNKVKLRWKRSTTRANSHLKSSWSKIKREQFKNEGLKYTKLKMLGWKLILNHFLQMHKIKNKIKNHQTKTIHLKIKKKKKVLGNET